MTGSGGAVPEILGSGPRDRPRRPGLLRDRRRRRLATVAGVLILVAGAGILAARSEPPARQPAARSTLPPTPSGEPGRTGDGAGRPGYAILDTAASHGRLFALLGSCAGVDGGGPCDYRLLVHAGGRWTTTPLPAFRLPAGGGFFARLLLTGPEDRSLVVLDEPLSRAYVSTDSGRTFAVRPVDDGPPVAALPASLVPEVVDGRVSVLDPGTGRRRALVAQPPLGSPAVTVSWEEAAGGVLRAAAQARDAVVVATSVDRGRTWTHSVVARVPYPVPALRLVSVPGRPAAYLLASTRPGPDGQLRLATVWRSTAPADRWRPVVGPAAPLPAFAEAVGMSDGSILLVTDSTGGGWRLFEAGRMRRVPEPVGEDGVPMPAILMHRSPDGTVTAIAGDGRHVLRWQRLAPGWRAERLPG